MEKRTKKAMVRLAANAAADEVVFSPAEYRTLKRLAEAQGNTLSETIRGTALRALGRDPLECYPHGEDMAYGFLAERAQSLNMPLGQFLRLVVLTAAGDTELLHVLQEALRVGA